MLKSDSHGGKFGVGSGQSYPHSLVLCGLLVHTVLAPHIPCGFSDHFPIRCETETMCAIVVNCQEIPCSNLTFHAAQMSSF